MLGSMRPLILLILSLCWGISAATSPQLSSVQKVYLLPMGGGLDQYLAQQLTTAGVFTVVADPKQADAVWSERVDAGFLKTMNELYPPAQPPATKEAAKKETEGELKGSAPAMRSLARGRGNVFLVGVASRQVIWSTYLKQQDRSSQGLHQAAREIVRRLQRDLAGKQ